MSFSSLAIFFIPALLVIWLGGNDSLSKLKAGHFGPFVVSGLLSNRVSQLVIDTEGRRIALLNTTIYAFDSVTREESSRVMSVVFDFDDVVVVEITCHAGPLDVVVFKLNKRIPSFSSRRELEYRGNWGTRRFFERLAPDLLIAKNSPPPSSCNAFSQSTSSTVSTEAGLNKAGRGKRPDARRRPIRRRHS